MGTLIALFLFAILVVYIYRYNNNFVPEDVQRFSDLLQTVAFKLKA